MLRAVLLDVGGTLWPDKLTVPPSDEPCIEHLRRLLPDVEPTHALLLLRRALANDNDALQQRTHAVLAGVLRELCGAKAHADPVAIRRALCQAASPGVQLFPGAAGLLTDIRRLGLRCVILSNVQVRGAAEYRRDFVDLGVADCIDDIVTSLEVGFRKPHVAMFETAVRVAGCDAAACVMIGNSELNDIRSAVSLGMRAIRVSIEQPLPSTTRAHAVADTLASVSCILERWAASVTSE